jgi:hypothetical protein
MFLPTCHRQKISRCDNWKGHYSPPASSFHFRIAPARSVHASPSHPHFLQRTKQYNSWELPEQQKTITPSPPHFLQG